MTRSITAYLLTCAAIGVAGGLVVAPANWASTVLFVTVPFASVAIAGLWLIPAVVGMRLLERPGTALLIGLISGLVAAPFSGYGLMSVVTNLWWAFFIELPFLIVIYRFWTVPQYFAGALAVGIVWPLLAAASFDLGSMAPWVAAVFFGLIIASCAAGVAVGLLIAAGLRRTGVGRAASRRARVVVLPGTAGSAKLEG